MRGTAAPVGMTIRNGAQQPRNALKVSSSRPNTKFTPFGLRASARGRGFDRGRIWPSRIPLARFDLAGVRLRAGRVLLSGHRAAWSWDGPPESAGRRALRELGRVRTRPRRNARPLAE